MDIQKKLLEKEMLKKFQIRIKRESCNLLKVLKIEVPEELLLHKYQKDLLLTGSPVQEAMYETEQSPIITPIGLFLVHGYSIYFEV